MSNKMIARLCRLGTEGGRRVPAPRQGTRREQIYDIVTTSF